MRDIVRFLVGIAAPFLLIFTGSGLIGLGMEYKIEFLLWAGGVTAACGLLWGCWLWLLTGD